MDTKNLIQSALDSDASTFKDGMNERIMSKVKDALDVKRMEISGNYFNNEPEVDPSVDIDDNLETSTNELNTNVEEKEPLEDGDEKL